MIVGPVPLRRDHKAVGLHSPITVETHAREEVDPALFPGRKENPSEDEKRGEHDQDDLLYGNWGGRDGNRRYRRIHNAFKGLSLKTSSDYLPTAKIASFRCTSCGARNKDISDTQSPCCEFCGAPHVRK